MDTSTKCTIALAVVRHFYKKKGIPTSEFQLRELERMAAGIGVHLDELMEVLGPIFQSIVNETCAIKEQPKPPTA